jgi:hypothetical protein
VRERALSTHTARPKPGRYLGLELQYEATQLVDVAGSCLNCRSVLTRSAGLVRVRYEGIIYVSGSSKAWATIEDLDAPEWVGTIAEIHHVAPRSGLHTIRIGEGARTGDFAVMAVDYDDELRRGTLAGRTPFGAQPEPG